MSEIADSGLTITASNSITELVNGHGASNVTKQKIVDALMDFKESDIFNNSCFSRNHDHDF